ncbi:hypothetical protein [Streptomyces azureus]|uniref:hypothetical protein n=1 Tax=Streptomyces azureus TaxID=146537 RepID=UPI000A919F01|nr:hypothetical protein [Streptomyces azureus]
MPGRPVGDAYQQVHDAPEGLSLVLVPGNERLPRGRPVDTGGLDRGATERAGGEEHDGAPGFGEAGAELERRAESRRLSPRPRSPDRGCTWR